MRNYNENKIKRAQLSKIYGTHPFISFMRYTLSLKEKQKKLVQYKEKKN